MNSPLNPLSTSRSTLGRLAVGLLAAAALTVGAASTPSLAQSPDGTGKKKEELRPPVPPPPSNSSPPTIPLLIGIALAGLVAGVAFIPSKRGHQD